MPVKLVSNLIVSRSVSTNNFPSMSPSVVSSYLAVLQTVCSPPRILHRAYDVGWSAENLKLRPLVSDCRAVPRMQSESAKGAYSLSC